MLRTGLLGVFGPLLLAAGTAMAQTTGRITGTVTSGGDSRPVAGAQVIVQGTNIGTLTGDDGRYGLSVAPGSYRLRVTRIGFAADSARDVVVTAGGQTQQNFTLQPTAAVLTGMVVIGYGEQRAERTAGSVGVVSSEQFNQGRVVSPQEAIQGKIAGVQVTENNEPGGAVSIRVRGTASVTASSEPLYVVDGVPLQSGGGVSTDPKRNPLNFINPQDIENITVLKDAASTAIYGSRGSNGVVVITTKKGRGTGTQVDFTSTVSSSRVTGEVEMLNAEQFRAAVQEHADSRLEMLGDANTNWRDLVTQNGAGRDQQIAVSGSREDMNYRLSLGYLDQTGVLLGSNVRRATASIGYADQLFGRFDVNANLKGSRSDDRFTPGSVVGNANAFAPTQPAFTDDGSFYYWRRDDGSLIPQATGNPLASISLVNDRGTTYRSIGNLETRYRAPFLQGLSATLNLGYDFASSRHTIFTPSNEYSQASTANGGNFQRYNPTQMNTLLDLYGNFNRDLPYLGQSNIDLTGGYSYEDSRADYPSIEANGLASDLLGTGGLPNARVFSPRLRLEESRLISFFGRGTYSVLDRYIATFSIRRDGSSKFGPNNQWGVFPAAAFAWRASEEAFMQRFGWLSDLKLRYSWGINGNQQFSPYQAVSTYLIGNAATSAQFGDEFITTIRPSGVDPNLKWEETTSNNFGFDWGVLDNRLAGTVDFYQKKTEDLLFSVQAPAGTNLSDFVLTNVGSVENRGLELGLNAQVLTGGWRGLTWSASFNASRNENELLSITSSLAGSGNIIQTGGISGGVNNQVQVLIPGQPVNTFYVYRRRFVDGAPVMSGSDLDMYEDLNEDGQITIDDRRPFHSPEPKWILGHSSNLTLGNFDGSFALRAYRGNYTYNNLASNLGHYGNLTAGQAPTNVHASALRTGFINAQYWNPIYVEDASFVRLDHITVGYTFRRLRQVQSVRLFGTVQNVQTWTDYTGVDPSAGINGIDNNLYPRSRTFLGGANLTF